MKRTIVVADLHGCLDELKDLLELVKYDPKQDRLISCGDVFDRGDYSVETLRFLRKIDAEVVLGNHEDKYIRYHTHQVKLKTIPGYVNPMSDLPPRKIELYEKLTDEDFSYLESLPCFISVNDTIKVIHAGAQPNIPFNKQRRGNLVYLRYVKLNGGAFAGTPHKANEPLNFWAEKWTGPECIIYGHFVHNFKEPVIHQNGNVWCIGIDNGCCFGGKLTALVFTEEDLHANRIGSVVQVPARRIYMPYKSNGVDINAY